MDIQYLFGIADEQFPWSDRNSMVMLTQKWKFHHVKGACEVNMNRECPIIFNVRICSALRDRIGSSSLHGGPHEHWTGAIGEWKLNSDKPPHTQTSRRMSEAIIVISGICLPLWKANSNFVQPNLDLFATDDIQINNAKQNQMLSFNLEKCKSAVNQT